MLRRATPCTTFSSVQNVRRIAASSQPAAKIANSVVPASRYNTTVQFDVSVSAEGMQKDATKIPGNTLCLRNAAAFLCDSTAPPCRLASQYLSRPSECAVTGAAACSYGAGRPYLCLVWLFHPMLGFPTASINGSACLTITAPRRSLRRRFSCNLKFSASTSLLQAVERELEAARLSGDPFASEVERSAASAAQIPRVNWHLAAMPVRFVQLPFLPG
jgi:hypothetical protein